MTKDEPFGVLAFDGDERVAAVSGFCFWNWLFADLVWVHPARRGTGLGRQIMQKAEEQARAMGLTGIYLWTASWQASDFYAKIGYERYVVFNDFPPGHQRFGFRKYL